MKIKLLRIIAGGSLVLLVMLVSYSIVEEGFFMTMKLIVSAGLAIVGLIIGLNVAFGRPEDLIALWNIFTKSDDI